MSNRIHRISFALVLGLLGPGCWAPEAPGCGDDVECGAEGDAAEEDVNESQDAIRGGADVMPASQFWRSTVSVNNGSCTGTIIGRRHVLAAAHCNVHAGSVVQFYSAAFPVDLWANVTAVYQRVG